MAQIMSQCSFSSTSYSPAETSVVSGVTVVATKPPVPTASGTARGSVTLSKTASRTVAVSSPVGTAVITGVGASGGAVRAMTAGDLRYLAAGAVVAGLGWV